MARKFGFVWDSDNCGYDEDRRRPIDDVADKIELALKQENPANELSRQHMQIFAPNTCFKAHQRSALRRQDFVLHDTLLRYCKRCGYTDHDGNQCETRWAVNAGVEEVPFDRLKDIADSEMMDFLYTVDGNFPKCILIASTDCDFFETYKCLADQGFTVFVAKNDNDREIWHVQQYHGVSVTYDWRCMPSGYGRLYMAAACGIWKVQGYNEEVQEVVVRW